MSVPSRVSARVVCCSHICVSRGDAPRVCGTGPYQAVGVNCSPRVGSGVLRDCGTGSCHGVGIDCTPYFDRDPHLGEIGEIKCDQSQLPLSEVFEPFIPLFEASYAFFRWTGLLGSRNIRQILLSWLIFFLCSLSGTSGSLAVIPLQRNFF